MPSLFALRGCIAALLVCTCLGAAAQDYSQRQLQDLVSRHLNAESLKPEITDQGNVRFRNQGRIFVIHLDERDPLYFRLTMAFAVDDKGADARVRHLEGCNAASSDVKAIKCYLDDDGDPVFAAEMFLVVPDDFSLAFDRLLRAMDSAFRRYNRRVNEGR